MARQKYGNIRSGSYASKAESKRAGELKMLVLAKEVTELVDHPKFEIIPKSKHGRALYYTADFSYVDYYGKKIVEDVKPKRVRKNGKLMPAIQSRDFPLRLRLFKERYGEEYTIRIIEK